MEQWLSRYSINRPNLSEHYIKDKSVSQTETSTLWQAANIGLRNYKTGTTLLIPECELVGVAQVTLLSATLTVTSKQPQICSSVNATG